MRILVLGAYGLIGLAISRALIASGHEVTGLARSKARGLAMLPETDWISADIGKHTDPAHWMAHLSGVNVVINASGVLQDGVRDDVAATQKDGIIALIQACEAAGVVHFIQISAPGAATDADTAFLLTKGHADAALQSSRLDWTILKPGLVIGPTAYGGTSLVRMLAAFPIVQPIALANAPVQTVALDDVARAVVTVIDDRLVQQSFDLVEDAPHTLETIVAGFRTWLGYSPARTVIRLPRWLAGLTAGAADMAGWLGWRPALRTTALKVLDRGVLADPTPWRHATGTGMKPLADTLRNLPSTRQERLYARSELAFPIALIMLAGFWIVSGLMGLWKQDEAVSVIVSVLGQPASRIFVLAGSFADIAIGLGLMVRQWVRPSALASIGLASGYLAAGALLTPHLWTDPLGPFVKVIPAIGLALLILALAEER